MQISTFLGYDGGFQEAARRVADYERVGLDLVWVAEAYGFDGPSFMGFLAARTERVQIASGILPIYSRTPTLIAMTAAGLDALSDGRFQLGLGASGPQVIEGWHGVPYDAPIGRTREIVEICRAVWAREAPLVHEGRYYQLPLPAGRGTGLGKPLKIIAHPLRPRIPVWLAALGERNVALAAEVADGWLPILFIPERADQVWGASLRAGRAKRDPALGPLQISAGGLLAIGDGDDVLAVRDLARPMVALYVGGMGAKGRNFYNDLACRYGFEKEAAEIQDLYLAGRKKEAEALVPDELLALTSLVGPRSWVAERVAAFRDAGVTHLQVTPVPAAGRDELGLLEELRQLVG
ncbi:LLM class F420-dependent oxidoreductase [Acidimicrobiaceae bacterium USS-CC1]|uniref:LLM class F420-dependent oxidoreductase n=1 Tax=Acidiferrimicrobium australe TaxID=2664430 RepID=A0ABW9QXX7_9ACTN|nr:LLM class F420-dependent oxidoreductase [Acidiferrimicrobium australe]